MLLLLFIAALMALVAGFILPIVQLHYKLIDVIVKVHLNHLAFNIARGSALGCDVGIAAVLCWQMRVRKTGVRR